MKITLATIKTFLKRQKYVTWLYAKAKSLGHLGGSQSNEALILSNLITLHDRIPKTFVEFGFSGWEFNCDDLCKDKTWQGLLIDADPYNCWTANARFGKAINVRQAWITRDNIKGIVGSWLGDQQLGILSIDVDGNDWWLLKELSHIRPAIIIMEYNSAFGLNKISAIYDQNFDRQNKHERWTYYGASLTIISDYLKEEGYELTAISESGVNAFYLRNDLIGDKDNILDPPSSFKDSFAAHGSSHEIEWGYIKHMDYARNKGGIQSGSQCCHEEK